MSVAAVYAKALFESLGSPGTGDQVEKEMQGFADTVEGHAELRSVLAGPIATPTEKAAMIKEIATKLNLSSVTQQFLNLLARKERLAILKEIVSAFKVMRLQSAGGLLGQLEAAESISESDVDALAQSFTKKLGKKVAFTVSVNPELLAGMRVTVGGTTYDGSLKTQLSRLRDEVLARA